MSIKLYLYIACLQILPLIGYSQCAITAIFPNTEACSISKINRSLQVQIEDRYYVLYEKYVKWKAGYLASVIREYYPKMDSLHLRIVKVDTLLYEYSFGPSEIAFYENFYRKYPAYRGVSDALFSQFNETDIWNWNASLFELGRYHKGAIGDEDLFDLLYRYSLECKRGGTSNQYRAETLLVEGLKLINSAGMRNFWNRAEVVDSADLLKHANAIFELCGSTRIHGEHKIEWKDGKHIIPR